MAQLPDNEKKTMDIDNKDKDKLISSDKKKQDDDDDYDFGDDDEDFGDENDDEFNDDEK